MAVDRTLAVALAETLSGWYGDLSLRLAADLGRNLRAGIASPGWAERKLSALSTLDRQTRRLLRVLEGRLGDEAARALVLAYARGGEEAIRGLRRQQLTGLERRLLRLPDLPIMRGLAALAERRAAGFAAELASAVAEVPGLAAIQRLAWTLVSTLSGTHTRILRWEQDTFRDVVANGGVVDVLAGTKTRLRAAQTTLDRALAKGITGFTDRSGRRWELASYVEMATRTATAQAAVEGHMDRLADLGVDLVIVSDAPQECKLCRPYEGKVLARRGSAGRIEVAHTTRPGERITVDVVATIDQAVAAGLLHPNCRHSLSAYLPGVTRAPTHTEDPQGDADRQRLRELERRVRRLKLREAGAIDPAAKAGLQQRIRETQAQIRVHVSTTGLLRQRHREQIGTAR